MNEQHSNSEKIVYSGLGTFIILKLMPCYIPFVLCFTGLIIGLFGIIDVINKSDLKSDFNYKEYIENKK